ncbi:MAG: TIM-barrel domain-containing protein [Phycisphaeraceae bacterium]
MPTSQRFLDAMLDLDAPEAVDDVLWHACKPTAVRVMDGVVVCDLPFEAYQPTHRGRAFAETFADEATPRQTHALVVRAYGEGIVRVTLAPGLTADDPLTLPEDHGMLAWDPSLKPEPLSVQRTDTGWDVLDTAGRVRWQVNTGDTSTRHWSDLIPPPRETLAATVFPDGYTAVPFMAYDQFFPKQVESLPLAFVERAGTIDRMAWALHAMPNERFAGTGERFARMDLAGQTLELVNTDALGTNNRRAYKNVPFYLSSRPYGLLALTPAHARLSLADVSTRAAQGVVEHDVLDLLFFAAGDAERKVERILHRYRQVTGFPPELPAWSYGTWMSRMSYWTADETLDVARRMREGGFPCDVIHLDTGWFDEDWKCDWKFSREKYPDPAAYMRQMRERGFRISLWQHPKVSPDTEPFHVARAQGYVPRRKAVQVGAGASNFGDREYGGDIDFTNPQAVTWYQGMLRKLLETGASVFKTDFGENIDLDAVYHGLPAKLLHNLYALLYQRANFEITQEVNGDDQGIIWARSAWVGAQRYPVHWSGDAACSFDGLAGSLRGGLHLGLSGFGYWSHDVPGFHGVPDFMNSWPSESLYLRWTQASVFVSHLRYHGTSPREPDQYPAVADTVRQWLRLRYALIPYLLEQARQAAHSGYPLLRALLLHHEDDPTCWHIDDQFFCGDHLLVCPVLNTEGVRDVYLPAGQWVDFWSGEVFSGPGWRKAVRSPLARIPVYVRRDAVLPVHPEPVPCTDEMNLNDPTPIRFDATYRGLAQSVLGNLVDL